MTDYHLTRQEQRIVEELLVNGCTNQELGQKFGTTEQTIRKQMFHIMEKTGFSTRTELAVNLLHQRYRAAIRMEGSLEGPAAITEALRLLRAAEQRLAPLEEAAA